MVASSVKGGKQAIINGTWERSGAKEVTLYQIVSGRLEPLSTYYLQDKERSFGFAFHVREEQFYAIGAGNVQMQMDKYVFYFKPGDVLSVAVNDTSYVLTGENTPENRAMEQWERYIHALKFQSLYFMKNTSTYKDFFPLLQEYLKKPFAGKATNNRVFERGFSSFQTVDFYNTALFFLVTPRFFHPTLEEYPDFYNRLAPAELTKNANLMAHPFGSWLLSELFYRRNIVKGVNPADVPLEKILGEIADETLKGEYLLREASNLKSYVGYVDLMKGREHLIKNSDQKRRASEIVTLLAQEETKPGQPAINFSGTDIHGKTVSLSDFKGSVVYVDIWATWCGPCVQEAPYFEKLIEEYQGKDIVFMSVSVDVLKDKPKWENFLKEKGSHGVQLYGGNGWESDVARFYQVNSIPRFLLFDKAGNIVSINAPRPSSSEIKSLLNKLLN